MPAWQAAGLLHVLAVVAWAAYTPYFTAYLSGPPDLNYWYSNAYDRSLISKVAVPDGTSDYEVRTVLNVTGALAQFVIYLRATNDALAPYAPSYNDTAGTYYAVELRDPLINGNSCAGWLDVSKRVGGTITTLAHVLVGCRPGMVLRASVNGNKIVAWADYVQAAVVTDSSIATGKPGVGHASSGAITEVKLFGADRTAPSPVSSSDFQFVRFANTVSLRWLPAADDANGSGVAAYQIWRNSTLAATVYPYQELVYNDPSVAAGISYTYTIKALDYLDNISTGTTAAVPTVAAEAVDAKRWGVHRLGAHWGGAGESIDMRSGNLNFTLPLVRARGRGETGITVALSYNSQLWRRKGTQDWKLGTDTGFGFGWRLMAGSVTPIWSDSLTLYGYLFTDSTGAEYMLNVYDAPTSTWSGKDSYMRYYAPNKMLIFNDGSHWYMDCQADLLEQDAGTRYPFAFNDSNGNQVWLYYQTGKMGIGPGGTSGRLTRIDDVRANLAYTFQYNNDPTPHVTSISNGVGSGEAYSFQMASLPVALRAPFTGSADYCPASLGSPDYCSPKLLQWVQHDGLLLKHQFEYGASSGAGEMSKAIFPYGGELRWDHRSFSYGNSAHTLREVQNRYLVKQGGATPQLYPLSHADGDDAARWLHSYTLLRDAGGVGEKRFRFSVTGGTTGYGLMSTYEGRDYPANLVKTQADYTWTSDAAGRPYVSSVLNTADPGQSYARQSKTEQTLDANGNVTQQKVYDFGNLTTPARTYNYGYLTAAAYLSANIRDRMTSATVTNGSLRILPVVDRRSPRKPITILPGNRSAISREFDHGSPAKPISGARRGQR